MRTIRKIKYGIRIESKEPRAENMEYVYLFTLNYFNGCLSTSIFDNFKKKLIDFSNENESSYKTHDLLFLFLFFFLLVSFLKLMFPVKCGILKAEFNHKSPDNRISFCYIRKLNWSRLSPLLPLNAVFNDQNGVELVKCIAFSPHTPNKKTNFWITTILNKS